MMGKACVYLDGNIVALIGLYSLTPEKLQLSAGVSPGTHTVILEASGIKEPGFHRVLHRH